MLKHWSYRQTLQHCILLLWKNPQNVARSIFVQLANHGHRSTLEKAAPNWWCEQINVATNSHIHRRSYQGRSNGDDEREETINTTSMQPGDLALLELLETTQPDGATVKSILYKDVSRILKAALASGRVLADEAISRVIKKAQDAHDIDDVFDILRDNRLRKYEVGDRVPYKYPMSGELFEQAISMAGERYVIHKLLRFHEEELPVARWRLRPLFKYCAFERPGDVRKIWQYTKISNLKRELGSEAVSIFRVYLDNDMLKEAQIFRDYEVKAYKVRLSGSEGLRKSIYFAIDGKARWVKSRSFVKKKGLDAITGKKKGTTVSITPDEHRSQPAWMDFARNK